MHQQGFNGVAGGRVLGLAIEGEPHRLLHIGSGIHEEVAEAIGVAQHGNAGVVLDVAHQGVGAPGDDQIHQAVEFQQRQALFPAGEQLQAGWVDAATGQAFF